MDGFAGGDTFKVQLNTFLVANKQDWELVKWTRVKTDKSALIHDHWAD